jgi:acyl carrier protein
MTTPELQGATPMASDILSILLEKLNAMRPQNAPSLSIEGARFATLQSLDLDSLDTLQFAMDIENALEMDIEIVSFPDTLTIVQLAERLAVMKDTLVASGVRNSSSQRNLGMAGHEEGNVVRAHGDADAFGP